MVLQEALRLYPSIWSYTRCALEDDEIGGYFIRPANPAPVALPDSSPPRGLGRSGTVPIRTVRHDPLG